MIEQRVSKLINSNDINSFSNLWINSSVIMKSKHTPTCLLSISRIYFTFYQNIHAISVDLNICSYSSVDFIRKTFYRENGYWLPIDQKFLFLSSFFNHICTQTSEVIFKFYLKWIFLLKKCFFPQTIQVNFSRILMNKNMNDCNCGNIWNWKKRINVVID